MIGSSASVAAGSPISARCSEQLARQPDALLDVERVVHERVVDEPFHPTVVRGFSK